MPMQQIAPVVGFTGPRGVEASAAPIINRVVQRMMQVGSAVAVGCATGVDAYVLAAALHIDPTRLFVFSVFDAQGVGGGKWSNVAGVKRSAEQGAAVNWGVGGTFESNYTVKLVRRSKRLIRFLSEAKAGGSLVGFVTKPPQHAFARDKDWPSCGSGTWATIAACNHRRLQVVVFPVAWPTFSPDQLPVLPGGPGEWQMVMGDNLPAGGYMWMRPPRT
jgi:hypothetical protein